jgi:hypothetical protein
MAMTVQKIILRWDAISCTLLEIYQRFGEVYCLFEDGSSGLSRNVGKYLIDCRLSHPKEDYLLVYFNSTIISV